MVDIEELVSRGVDGLEVPNGHAIHPLLQPLFPGGLMPAVYRLDGASRALASFSPRPHNHCR